jgi:large subunit ribosomal protein L11
MGTVSIYNYYIKEDTQFLDEITGKLTVKHIYEIAKIKADDKTMIGIPIKEICQLIIQRAQEIGIKVQNEDLDAEQLKDFLDERREIVKKQLEEIAQKEAAKLLRT